MSSQTFFVVVVVVVVKEIMLEIASSRNGQNNIYNFPKGCKRVSFSHNKIGHIAWNKCCWKMEMTKTQIEFRWFSPYFLAFFKTFFYYIFFLDFFFKLQKTAIRFESKSLFKKKNCFFFVTDNWLIYALLTELFRHLKLSDFFFLNVSFWLWEEKKNEVQHEMNVI